MQISSSNSRKSTPSNANAASSARLSVFFDQRHGIEPSPITVSIAGKRYTVAPRTAGEWFQSLQRAGWLQHWRIIGDEQNDPDGVGAAGVVAACLQDDPGAAYRLNIALADGKVTTVGVAAAGRKIMTKAAGVDWWVAERVAIQSVMWSGIGAELYMKGLRPETLPLPVWLGAAYRTWMGLLDDKERFAADTALSLPPAGYDSDEPLPSSLGELFV